MMDNTPCPDEVERSIGKFHSFCVHLQDAAWQSKDLKATSGTLDSVARDVNADVTPAMRRDQFRVTAVANADFQNVRVGQRCKRDQLVEGLLLGRAVMSRIAEVPSINLFVKLGREFCPGNWVAPVVAHGVALPPGLIPLLPVKLLFAICRFCRRRTESVREFIRVVDHLA